MSLFQTSSLSKNVIVVLAVTVSMSASAAPTTTNAAPQNTPYTVLSNDLLQTSVTGHVNTSNAGVITDTNSLFTFSDGTDTGIAAGVVALTNGSFGTMPPSGTGPKNRADFAGIVGQGSGINATLAITYAFDLSASSTGYNLTGIDIYTAWNNSGRDGIRLNIYYATVSAPTTFTLLTSIENNPTSSLSPIAEKSSVTDSLGGFLATNVSSIRFTFPTQENSGVGYREIDVTGFAAVPEPGSVGFAMAAVLAVIVISRRRFARR